MRNTTYCIMETSNSVDVPLTLNLTACTPKELSARDLHSLSGKHHFAKKRPRGSSRVAVSSGVFIRFFVNRLAVC